MLISICVQGYDNNWTIDNSFTRNEFSFINEAEAVAYCNDYNSRNYKEFQDGNSYYRNGYYAWIAV